MEERIGEAEGVFQLGRHGNGAGRAFERAVGEAEHPQGEGGGRESRYAGVVAEAEPAGPVGLRLERGDGSVEVVEAAVEIVLQGEAGAQDEMSVDAHARVGLSLRQAQDISPDLGSLVELGTVVVEAGEAAEDREELRELSFSREELEGVRVRLLDFLRVPVNGHQRPRQAGPESDLLHRALGRRRCRR